VDDSPDSIAIPFRFDEMIALWTGSYFSGSHQHFPLWLSGFVDEHPAVSRPTNTKPDHCANSGPKRSPDRDRLRFFKAEKFARSAPSRTRACAGTDGGSQRQTDQDRFLDRDSGYPVDPDDILLVEIDGFAFAGELERRIGHAAQTSLDKGPVFQFGDQLFFGLMSLEN
jgi:hypothetical protein